MVVVSAFVFLAYFRLRNCRPQLASRKCLPPRLKEKKLGFFSIYLGLFPFGSVFNQVSISRLYISPTVRCTDSRWKLELNTLPKVKSLDKFKKTPLFFLRLWKSIVRLVSNGVNTIPRPIFTLNLINSGWETAYRVADLKWAFEDCG